MWLARTLTVYAVVTVVVTVTLIVLATTTGHYEPLIGLAVILGVSAPLALAAWRDSQGRR